MTENPQGSGENDPTNPFASPTGSQNPALGQSPSTDDNLTTADWVLAILCSGIGCILGIVWLIQGKKKAGKMIGISLLFGILWRVVITIITTMANS